MAILGWVNDFQHSSFLLPMSTGPYHRASWGCWEVSCLWFTDELSAAVPVQSMAAHSLALCAEDEWWKAGVLLGLLGLRTWAFVLHQVCAQYVYYHPYTCIFNFRKYTWLYTAYLCLFVSVWFLSSKMFYWRSFGIIFRKKKKSSFTILTYLFKGLYWQCIASGHIVSLL